MTISVEREVKLRYESVSAALAAATAARALPLRGRRLQDDRLLDWPDGRLRKKSCALRIRLEYGSAVLTFKGPPQLATMKVREELETTVGEPTHLLALLERLGLGVWFRYQKYREEFKLDGVVVAVDETPIGTFIELEGGEQGIMALAGAMGHTAEEYVLDSYRSLFLKEQAERGLDLTDMVFNP